MVTAADQPPVRIVEASEHLETEDLLEMVNAGLIPATIADSHLAGLWQQVFTAMRVHTGAVVRSGGQITWVLRRGTPELGEPGRFLRQAVVVSRVFKFLTSVGNPWWTPSSRR